MEILDEIEVRKVQKSRLPELDMNHLDFGSSISDHMFYCVYENEEWQRPRIVPFDNISLSPATLALHYGQSVFEGMKAFRMNDGSVTIFRIEKHHERLNKSLFRMCMPSVPFDLFSAALQQLVHVDKEWIPNVDGSSLYIRPLIFASEAKFGVKVSSQYTFIIFTGPVAPFFQKPIRLKVEREFVRAPKGGTGSAKCAGNYGGVFYPTQLAREQGFDQVLWTDSKENEYIEESGMMNAMFVIDGTLVTPPLSDSILDGITRDSFLQLAKQMNVPVEERPVSVTELVHAFRKNTITEAFGAGTAAVVAPIASIHIDGIDYKLPEYSEQNIMFLLKKKLNAIRLGEKNDEFGWNTIIN